MSGHVNYATQTTNKGVPDGTKREQQARQKADRRFHVLRDENEAENRSRPDESENL